MITHSHHIECNLEENNWVWQRFLFGFYLFHPQNLNTKTWNGITKQFSGLLFFGSHRFILKTLWMFTKLRIFNWIVFMGWILIFDLAFLFKILHFINNNFNGEENTKKSCKQDSTVSFHKSLSNKNTVEESLKEL